MPDYFLKRLEKKKYEKEKRFQNESIILTNEKMLMVNRIIKRIKS
jgi:hypothetical protein